MKPLLKAEVQDRYIRENFVRIEEGFRDSDTAFALNRAPRYTTTTRDALNPVAGMIILNTTTSKFQGYTGTAWVDLN